MKSYIHRTPWWLKMLYPNLIWEIKTTQKDIFLTFDDGPIPTLTPFILKELDRVGAKATFFCVGDNIRKHSDIFNETVKRGHLIGNHTYNHLNGWQTSNEAYMDNVDRCQQQIDPTHNTSNKRYFRPPYGKISRNSIRKLIDGYDVVMWTNLTGDFDQELDKRTCLKRAIKNTKRGSIVVFHDNIKAAENLYYVLPKYLDHMKQQGYNFRTFNQT